MFGPGVDKQKGEQQGGLMGRQLSGQVDSF